MQSPRHYYVAFVDETGDPGITRVRPIDKVGGSEWLAIGSILIEVAHEQKPVEWVRAILQSIGTQQRRELHFRDLTEWRKPLVCQAVATYPLKIFVLTSNKKNMRGHINPRVEAKSSPLAPRQYFYNYCLRLILERITDFCLRHSMKTYGEPRHVKIIFSERGGHAYGHTIAYQEILKNQSRSETTYLDKRTIKWQVVDRRLMEVTPHSSNAGLQLADVIASSFYQAVDILPPTAWNPMNAKLLKPRVAKEFGFFHDYGVAFQPIPAYRARLLPRQKEIFEFYGYDGRDF
jgi:Protein of unknown function (DUF3800)